MTWTNRVVWQEGMFLRAQHFQQQDRWLEMLARARSAPLRSYPWGVVEMSIGRDLLATGRFALSAASGVFEDGRGIGLQALDAAPREIESLAGAICFELDRSSPHWQRLQSSSGFAIHVSGDVPNLRLQLWAIRG